MPATSVVRRVRPKPATVEEPVKIIEPEVQDTPQEPDDDSLDGVERSARAASCRTDYDAIIVKFREKATNRKNAIRAMCVECMGGMVYEVAKCTSTRCPLWAFRMGENPNDARTIAAKAKKEAEAKPPAVAKPAATGRTVSRPIRRTR